MLVHVDQNGLASAAPEVNLRIPLQVSRGSTLALKPRAEVQNRNISGPEKRADVLTINKKSITIGFYPINSLAFLTSLKAFLRNRQGLLGVLISFVQNSAMFREVFDLSVHLLHFAGKLRLPESDIISTFGEFHGIRRLTLSCLCINLNSHKFIYVRYPSWKKRLWKQDRCRLKILLRGNNFSSPNL